MGPLLQEPGHYSRTEGFAGDRQHRPWRIATRTQAPRRGTAGLMAGGSPTAMRVDSVTALPQSPADQLQKAADRGSGMRPDLPKEGNPRAAHGAGFPQRERGRSAAPEPARTLAAGQPGRPPCGAPIRPPEGTGGPENL